MTLAILAQEPEETSSNVSLVLPETNELIAGIVAFAIVFFFVWKWALPAINRTLEARQTGDRRPVGGGGEGEDRSRGLLARLREPARRCTQSGQPDNRRGAARQLSR